MKGILCSVGAAILWCGSLQATVSITALTPSLTSPQPLGTPVSWTATATDTHTGPLAFEFSTAPSGQTPIEAQGFLPGSGTSGTRTSHTFIWTTIAGEGTYNIQVVAKDFSTGESATMTASFTYTTLVKNGAFTISKTANPLVALASIPACRTGDTVKVTFSQPGASRSTSTNTENCLGTISSNFYVAGMLPSTTYAINYTIANSHGSKSGTPINFTTGPLPSGNFPTQVVLTSPQAGADTADGYLVHSLQAIGGRNLPPDPVATNLNGQVLWFYNATQGLMTRVLPGGDMLLLQSGYSWDKGASTGGQVVAEIDLAGNMLHQTNIGYLQQQLIGLGFTDMGPCDAVPLPAAIGAACLTAFHHEAVRLPNGYTAVLCAIEKIYPPGTQGDTSGLNVDIQGNGVIVLDTNWQVVWAFDAFQHASGAPQLDINRAGPLDETCPEMGDVCPPTFLTSTPGVTSYANDWMHCNSIYYHPQDTQLIVSSRAQDWIFKIDYQNATGTGNVLWRLGKDGDFTFNNIFSDPYPWFSHQHDAGIENGGTGVMTLFDNGNTRVAPPPLGLGSGNSRGMALTVDESTMTVTPVLSQDLGYFSQAVSSAQLLSNGDYLFQPGVVGVHNYSYSIQISPPKSGTDTGSVLYNLETEQTSYRSFQMSSLYNPPTT